MPKTIVALISLSMLMVGVISAQTIIPGGNVSGTWDVAGSPYLIEGEIIVPEDELLIIEPGVDVIFQDHYKLIVDGGLTAIGTETDSITFTAADPDSGWHSIRMTYATDTTHLEYCVLEYGKATGVSTDAYGGGIRCSHSYLILVHSSVINCSAVGAGGGIYFNYASGIIEDCRISGNVAGGRGGGVGFTSHSSYQDMVIIRDSVIDDNSASDGGGLSVHYGSAFLGDNEITNNSATGGGGIWCGFASNIDLNGNFISGNIAYMHGGGIRAQSTIIALLGDTLTENSAELGGGIYFENATSANLDECTISHNTATDEGGGIYCHGLYFNADYCLISHNSAQTGGAAYTTYNTEVNLDHCTLSENEANICGGFYFDSISLDISNSIIWSNAEREIYFSAAVPAVSYSDIDEDLWPGQGNISSDPLFEDPFSGNFQLDWRSPCIDAGDPTYPLDPDSTRTDMGAFYYHYTPTGTTIPEGNVSGVWYPMGSPYLIEGEIEIPEGETLTIQAGVEVIFQGFYRLDVEGTLSAQGSEFDSVLFTAADTSEGWKGLWVVLGESYCDMDYCVIEYGKALGPTSNEEQGGGLHLEDASGYISNCTFRNNYAALYGGGVYWVCLSQTEFVNCLFVGNTASEGGGFFATGGGEPLLQNCTFMNNYAGENGGGLYLAPSPAAVKKCLFIENSAVGNGGAVYISGVTSPIFENCTTTFNSASSGGGFFLNSGSATIKNTIIAYNSNAGIFFGSAPNSVVRYNDFYLNEGGDFAGSVPPYLGEITNVNFNGDSCDVYSNIFLDPLFNDPAGGDFRITEDSPCIDAGDPQSPYDPDGTIADIGAFYYHQVFGTTIPGGTVSGTWDLEGSPYMIQGNINVQSGDTLIIEPGVEVIFEGYYELLVNGQLHAVGTEEDSILFTAEDTTAGWVSLKVSYTQEDVQISYCIIEYANTSGIYCWSSSPVISHCTIRSCQATSRGGAFYAQGWESHPTLSYCNMVGNTADFGGGVGIYLCGSLLMEHCTIRDNSAIDGGAMFWEENYSLPVVNNCLFWDNVASGWGGAIDGMYGGYPTINNSTFFGNSASTGGAISYDAVVTNSIFWNNYPDQISWPITVTYTCVQNGYTGIGNISDNPIFVQGPLGDFYLSQTAAGQSYQSPCADAGNPASSLIDGTTRTDQEPDTGTVDMGFHYSVLEPPEGIYVALTALSSTVIPPSGGIFRYNIEVGNNGTQSEVWDIWINATLPDSFVWHLAGPKQNVLFNPGWSGDRDRLVILDALAPTGIYTINGYVGDYHPTDPTIVAEDHLPFTKTGEGSESSAGDLLIDAGDFFDDLNVLTTTLVTPAAFALHQNFPNPFNLQTTIRYQLPEVSFVNLSVYDISGRKVAELVNGWRDVGYHEITFDALGLSSGLYIYRFTSDNYITSEKMILLK